MAAESASATAATTLIASESLAIPVSSVLSSALATLSSTPSPSDSPPSNPSTVPAPPGLIFRYIIGFLLIGIAWGFTTPFIRAAARAHKPAPHALLESDAVKRSWFKSKVYGAFFAVVDLLRNPRYAVPLVINLTGSVWFFLLIGQAELSLTVPITNSLAFLFTVLGDWWVDRKVISRGTWLGMALSLGGIALCVHSKS